MLIQFAVENYMSLRDETVLSMDAGAGSEHRENLQEYQDGYLLPTAAIYGANAAEMCIRDRDNGRRGRLPSLPDGI